MALLVTSTFPLYPAIGQAQLLAFAEAAKLVGQVADAMASVAKAIPEILKGSFQSVDIVYARQAQGEMAELSRDIAIISGQQKPAAIDAMDEYAIAWHRQFPNGNRNAGLPVKPEFSEQWDQIKSRLLTILGRVRPLLVKLRQTRTDLVTQDVYVLLLQSLQGREELLPRIARLSPPYQTSEIVEFERLTANYKRLATELRNALRELNAYIRASAA